MSTIGLYRLRLAALSGRTAWYRHKYRDLEPIGKAMLETQHYRQSMFDFFEATVADPDILVDAHLKQGDLVFDVGAHIGEWSARLVERYDVEVHAFEPDPASLPGLRRVARNHEAITVHPYGLGDRDQQLTLNQDGPGSSMFGGPATFGTATVAIRDILGVLNEVVGDRELALLKLNIEGAEFDLLDQLLDSRWIERCHAVSVQFHEWHPRAYWRRATIRHRLLSTHSQRWCYPWVWEFWERH